MHTIVTRASLAAVAGGALLALCACGGSAGGSGKTTAGAGGGAGTVSTQTVDGVGNVLVDSRGDALYFADQEADGMIACTGGCTKIWLPLTLPAGTDASGGGSLGAKLGTVERPGGESQVTWNGKPLYRFAEDGGAGTVSGDGASDSFGGTDFSWHVARTGNATGGSTGTTRSGGGYSY